MRFFGQDEEYYDFYNPPTDDVQIEWDTGLDIAEELNIAEELAIAGGLEEPSETRYVQNYQEQQAAIQLQAESGAGFFDIFKSILNLATPVAISMIRAGQQPATPVLRTSTGIPIRTSQAGFSLGTLTSNPLLLIGLGLGGLLLLRKRGGK